MPLLNSFQIYEDLSQNFDEKAARSLTKVLAKLYEGFSESVTKSDFNELKVIVSQLSEAQKRTEARHGV